MLVINKLLARLLTRQRYRTVDREHSDVFVSEKIGPKRAKTPEGFLLCMDVPVARVGTMVYGAGEVPLETGADGLVHVMRGEKDLFDDKALASYVGKPVVDDHPDEDVNPANWKDLAIGIVLNPRRGVGDDSDVMLADLLITDASAIRDVDEGKREVSAGYEADYEQTGPGTGRQTNIIGNHVALVERGRCGPRCAIGDHQPKELQSMTTKNTRPTKAALRMKVADRIRKLFGDAGEEMAQALPEALAAGDEDGGEGSGGDTHIHVHTSGEAGADAGPADVANTQDDPVEARFQQLETSIGEIKALLSKLTGAGGTGDEGGAVPGAGANGDGPAGKEVDGPAGGNALAGADDVKVEDGMPDEVQAAMASKTNDSAALETSFKAVLSDAEVLVPGFRLPTFDSKAKRKATMDQMCSLRRGVLGNLAAATDGAALLNAIGGSFDPQKASCVSVATTFRAAAGAKRLLNNSAGTQDAHRLPNAGLIAPGSRPKLTLAGLNKLHSKYHEHA
jgi:hypothetical protein